jgi:hypothetical protein
MSHDIACRITALPPVRTVLPRLEPIPAFRSTGARRADSQPRRSPGWKIPGIAFLYFIARGTK